MLYTVKPGADAGMIERLRSAFDRVEGIARVVAPRDYEPLGLPTPAENIQAPDLLLVAKDGYAFEGGKTAPAVVDAAAGSGSHGYLNTDPQMDAIFVAWGRGIRPGARLDRIRNVDVAPTIASLLGIDFQAAEGRPLSEFLAPK